MIDFDEWVDYGILQGWISKPTCYFHETFPMTEEEEEELDESGETCIPVSRFYEDKIGGNNGSK